MQRVIGNAFVVLMVFTSLAASSTLTGLSLTHGLLRKPLLGQVLILGL